MTAPLTTSLTVVDADSPPSSLVIDVPPGTSPEVWRYVERVGETLEALLAAFAADPPAALAVVDRGERTRTTLDLQARRLWRDGEQIHLTHLEFELLSYFVGNRSRAITREELLDHVWNQPAWPGSSRTVDVHIRRLRHKLGREFRLATLRGYGYRLDG